MNIKGGFLSDFNLTHNDFEWFEDRISESNTGRVIIPSHCYRKFKKIEGCEDLSNSVIKCWLIDNVYNEK